MSPPERLRVHLDDLAEPQFSPEAQQIRDMMAALAQRSIDVRFDDFMADEFGVAERVYGLVGEPVTDDARTAMTAYLAGHERGRLGRVVTSCEMFGLNEGELRERFAAYVSRFLS